MRWEAHEAIAEEVAKALGLPKKLEKVLRASVIEPDKERGAGELHHEPLLSRRRAIELAWRAREAHVKGSEVKAVRYLGWALHFIHDACVPRGYIDPLLGGYYAPEELVKAHDYVERATSRMKPPRQAVEEGLGDAVNSPHYVERLVKKVRPRRIPEEALFEATYASVALAKAVLSETEPPEELVASYRLAKAKYLRRTIPLALLASLVAFLAALAALPQLASEYAAFIILSTAAALLLQRNAAPLLLLLFLFPYGLGNLVNAATSGLLAGYAVQRLDLRFHRLRKEAKWFGLTWGRWR